MTNVIELEQRYPGRKDKTALFGTYPHTLQQALSGQGFNSAMSSQFFGLLVPGFWGPQTAFRIVAGIGGSPELMHILPDLLSES